MPTFTALTTLEGKDAAEATLLEAGPRTRQAIVRPAAEVKRVIRVDVHEAAAQPPVGLFQPELQLLEEERAVDVEADAFVGRPLRAKVWVEPQVDVRFRERTEVSHMVISPHAQVRAAAELRAVIRPGGKTHADTRWPGVRVSSGIDVFWRVKIGNRGARPEGEAARRRADAPKPTAGSVMMMGTGRNPVVLAR